MFQSKVQAGRIYGPITVNKNISGADADGFLTNIPGQKAVQLQQVVSTPGATSTSRSTGFSGLKGANARESTRTFLLSGLAPETTMAEVLANIAANPDAVLYQVMSLQPILTDGQRKRVDSGENDIDTYAVRQALRPSNDGPLILTEDGEVQYRACFLNEHGKEDEDERDLVDSYIPASLHDEVAAIAAAAPARPLATPAPVAAAVTI